MTTLNAAQIKFMKLLVAAAYSWMGGDPSESAEYALDGFCEWFGIRPTFHCGKHYRMAWYSVTTEDLERVGQLNEWDIPS